MDREEILEEINKTKEHLANMEKILEECEYERWKPEKGKKYYFINSCNIVMCEIRDANYSDAARYDIYNCFKTREQAEQEAEKILIRRQLEDIARRLDKGEKIDWHNEEQPKYSIRFNYCPGKIVLDRCFRQQALGVVYCLDKNFLDVAIQEIGKERLKKYLRGE